MELLEWLGNHFPHIPKRNFHLALLGDEKGNLYFSRDKLVLVDVLVDICLYIPVTIPDVPVSAVITRK